MNDITRNYINKNIKSELGMTYDEFDSLDFDEQQRLIEQNRKNKKTNIKNVKVMIGSGEHAIFVNKIRGERYMLADGTFVRAGDTPEQSRNRLEDRIDDAIYSKPVASIKKLARKIKNK